MAQNLSSQFSMARGALLDKASARKFFTSSGSPRMGLGWPAANMRFLCSAYNDLLYHGGTAVLQKGCKHVTQELCIVRFLVIAVFREGHVTLGCLAHLPFQ